jgi:hypothetical protein
MKVNLTNYVFINSNIHQTSITIACNLYIYFQKYLIEEEFEDTKRVIRIRISKKNRKKPTMDKRKSTKGQTTIYKTYTQS